MFMGTVNGLDNPSSFLLPPQNTTLTDSIAWGSPSLMTGSARRPTPTSSPKTWSVPGSCREVPAAAR